MTGIIASNKYLQLLEERRITAFELPMYREGSEIKHAAPGAVIAPIRESKHYLTICSREIENDVQASRHYESLLILNLIFNVATFALAVMDKISQETYKALLWNSLVTVVLGFVAYPVGAYGKRAFNTHTTWVFTMLAIALIVLRGSMIYHSYDTVPMLKLALPLIMAVFDFILLVSGVAFALKFHKYRTLHKNLQTKVTMI